MDEYIRREDALEITTRTCGDYAAAWAEIRKLPAADVAEVVRCKDCRWRGREECAMFYRCDDYNLPYCEPDSFCSHGKRKEDLPCES